MHYHNDRYNLIIILVLPVLGVRYYSSFACIRTCYEGISIILVYKIRKLELEWVKQYI